MLTVKEVGELFEAVTALSAGIQVKSDRFRATPGFARCLRLNTASKPASTS